MNAAGTSQRVPPFLGPGQGLGTSLPRLHVPTCGRHVGGHDSEGSAQLQEPPTGCDTSEPTTKGTCILLWRQGPRCHVLDRHRGLFLPARALPRPQITSNDEVARAAQLRPPRRDGVDGILLHRGGIGPMVGVGLKGPPPRKQGGRMQLSPRGSQPWCHQTGVPKAQPPVLQRRCARRGGCMMVGHGATNILRYLRGPRAVSSVGSEHLVYTEGVGGSSPSPPTPITPQRPLHCRGFLMPQHAPSSFESGPLSE